METRSGNLVPFVEHEPKERAPPLPKIQTRNASLIPIIEEPMLDQLNSSRLPTRLEVFSHLFYLQKTQNLTVKRAQREAVKAASSVWELVSIAPKTIFNGIRMLTRICEDYQVQHLFMQIELQQDLDILVPKRLWKNDCDEHYPI